MNTISSIYASLYHSRIKEGLSTSEDPLTGNLVLSCCFIILLGSIFSLLYLFIPGVAEGADDFLKSIFGRRSGKTIGRFLVIILMLFIYPIIRYTVGAPQKYKQVLEDYKTLSAEEQEQAAKQGNWAMGLSLGSFVLPAVIGMIKTFL